MHKIIEAPCRVSLRLHRAVESSHFVIMPYHWATKKLRLERLIYLDRYDCSGTI